MTGEDLTRQRTRTQSEFSDLGEREKQIQASFWAQNFLMAELAAANRLLRNLLIEKGIFTSEEDTALGEDVQSKETLKFMYDNIEKAFYDKYQRVRYAMENPQVVEEMVKEREEANNV